MDHLRIAIAGMGRGLRLGHLIQQEFAQTARLAALCDLDPRTRLC